MASIYEFLYQDKNILCLDLSGLQLTDKSKFQELIQRAREKIESYSPQSVLTITNITNTGFDIDAAAMLGDFATHNTPYVRASALVGSTGMQKAVINTIRATTAKEFYLANSMEDARDWLIRH